VSPDPAAESRAPSAKRLFLGVNLSIASTRRVAEAVDRLRRNCEGGRGPKVSWVPPANLHVTLKFLGWTRPEVVPAIRARVAAGVAARKPFEIEAVGTGAFPSPSAARVLWVGVRDAGGTLAALAHDVEDWMAELGFEREARPYHPHITLGRVRDLGGAECTELLGSTGVQSFGGSSIREVVLYESITKSRGSEYSALCRMPLEASEKYTERQTRGLSVTDDSRNETEEPDDNGGQR
jgi:RNA 2',3'-cyclic 3'-phosphodiesterase